MRKSNYIFFIVLGLVVGVIVALFIGNFTSITLERKITLGELGNIVVTVLLALLIPFSLTKWVEDAKTIKGLFVYEADASLDALNDIKNVIEESYNSNVFVSDINKRKITFLFTILDNKIYFLTSRLNDKYSSELADAIKEIDDKNIAYWNQVTSGDLMTTQFTIDEGFMRRHAKAYSAIENILKKIKYDVSEL